MKSTLVFVFLVALLSFVAASNNADGGDTRLDLSSATAIKVRKALLNEINRARAKPSCAQPLIHEIDVESIEQEVVSGVLFFVQFYIGDEGHYAEVIIRPNSVHTLDDNQEIWEEHYFIRVLMDDQGEPIDPCDFAPLPHETSDTEEKESVRVVNSDVTTTWHATLYDRTFSFGDVDRSPDDSTDDGASTLQVDNFPTSFDLRTDPDTKNCAALKVEDQKSCGSCWAFAASHALALRLCKKSKGSRSYEFSEQWIMCNAGLGCSGGTFWDAFNVAQRTGMVFENSYPYAAQMTCPALTNPTAIKAKQSSGVCYTSSLQPSEYKTREKLIQQEIMNGGVSLAFEVLPNFMAYRSGIYSCTGGTSIGGHAVTAVGWGQEIVNGNVVKYWILKNSWGAGWGEKGFFRMRRGSNDCKIETRRFCFGTMLDPLLTCANGEEISCSNGTPDFNSCTCTCNSRYAGPQCDQCKPCLNGGISDPSTCKCTCPTGFQGADCEFGVTFSATCEKSNIRLTMQSSKLGPEDYIVVGEANAPFNTIENPEKILARWPKNVKSKLFPFYQFKNKEITVFAVQYLGKNEFGQSKGWAFSKTSKTVKFGATCTPQ